MPLDPYFCSDAPASDPWAKGGEARVALAKALREKRTISCVKTMYRDFQTAKLALLRKDRRPSVAKEREPYYCETCGGWHLRAVKR